MISYTPEHVRSLKMPEQPLLSDALEAFAVMLEKKRQSPPAAAGLPHSAAAVLECAKAHQCFDNHETHGMLMELWRRLSIEEARLRLSDEQLAILEHTETRAAGNRYCGDSPDMQVLVAAGLMRGIGKAPGCPDEYFTITTHGRSTLRKALAARMLGAACPVDETPDLLTAEHVRLTLMRNDHGELTRLVQAVYELLASAGPRQQSPVAAVQKVLQKVSVDTYCPATWIDDFARQAGMSAEVDDAGKVTCKWLPA